MVLRPRAILPLLRRRLERWPVTVLTGSRQTGKTTLVRDILPAFEPERPAYYSLDDPDERLRLSVDPVRRLDHGKRLVILDEIQKLPVLLDAVKLLADDSQGHRFLLLGSSQILLLERVRETLAGRATLLDLWPLGMVERGEGAATSESALDRIFQAGVAALEDLASNPPSANEARIWEGHAETALTWGGYPGLGVLEEEDRGVWLRDFRRTYLERDLADLGRVADLDQFAMAQRLLAAHTAKQLSFSTVSRDLGVAVNTVKRYVRFLEISYQVHLLQPLLASAGASLVKTPKLYFTDTGLVRYLSERWSLSEGPLFETAVFAELLRWRSWRSDPPSLHFYRTRAGREIDFVVRAPSCTLAIEVKASRRASPHDARPVQELLAGSRFNRGPARAHSVGLVVTQGREIERLSPTVYAIPFWRLFGPAR